MNYLMNSKKGTILIIATMVVVLLSAISATLIMQIHADKNYTEFTRKKVVVENVLKGAIHESLLKLNVEVYATAPTPNPTASGNLPETLTWTLANDVGIDGVPNTGDLGEGDGSPTFAVPGIHDGPGEPGAIATSIYIGVGNVGTATQVGVQVDPTSGDQSFQAMYAVFDESLGANGVDDNFDNLTDLPDDLLEAGYRRLRATAFFAGEFRTKTVLVASSQAITPGGMTPGSTTGGLPTSEIFFKAIYAGNSSKDPNYFMDMGGPGINGDDVNGDVYITGNIRLSNAAMMWKTEKYTDVNGNGMFDFGDTWTDDNGQEAGYYNFGTEAQGSVNMRSTISSSNWKTKQPTIGGTGPYSSGAPEIGTPDFSTSIAQITVDVGAEIAAKGTNVTVPNSNPVSGKRINNINDPAHMFVKANSNEMADLKSYYHASYVDNGLDNYIFVDTVVGDYSGMSAVALPASGNNQVYKIPGNLLFGQDGVTGFYFQPPANTDHTVPLRVTFLVEGNVVLNDNFVYRNTASNNSSTSYPNDKNYNPGYVTYGTSAWNPFDDAFAMIALKNPNAPTNSGNVAFADYGSATLGYIDAILYAENDFVSNYGTVDPTVQVNGMMLAGNHVRINQEFHNGEWRARPDSSRNRYIVNFDTRIRNLIGNGSWLPGLPGGTNRSVAPPAPITTPDEYYGAIITNGYSFDTILSGF